MKRHHYLLLIFLCTTPWSVVFGQSTGEIRGIIKDTISGEPAAFVNVYLQGTSIGVLTDVNGFYSLSKVPKGDYTLVVKGIGYDSLATQVSIEPGKIKTQTFQIRQQQDVLETVEISGDRVIREKTVNIGVARIEPEEIKALPSIGGESDLTQYLTTVPGVVSTGDQGGRIYIRGGAPYQTLTMLDGMIVYVPFHSIGLYSIFDTDILKNVNLMSAGYNATYGGRTSAVLDVTTKDGNANRHSGVLSANPIAGKASITGPLAGRGKDYSITYVGSFRHAWLNETAPVLYDYAIADGEESIPFSFTDVYGKITAAGDKGSKISLFGFNFRDRTNLNFPASFAWDASGVGTEFTVLPSNASALINGRFAYSGYRIDQTNNTDGFDRNSEVNSFNGRMTFTYFFKENELKYGFEAILNGTSYQAGDPLRQGNNQVLEANNSEFVGFVNYLFVRKKFVLEPGLHIHYYASLNAGVQPEPRIGLKYNVSRLLRFKAAAGLYSQALVSARSDREVVDLFTGFITSPTNANAAQLENDLQTSVHYVAGFEYEPTEYLLFNVEGYVKDFSNIIGVNRLWVVEPEEIGDQPDFIGEDGLVQGLDIGVKFTYRRFNVNANYGLMEVTRNAPGFTYFPNFDRRHNVNFLGTYSFGAKRQHQLGLRWNLGSGFPFTETVAFYERLPFRNGIQTNVGVENGDLGIFYGEERQINRGRLPYYHRMDLDYTYTLDLEGPQVLKVKAGASNLYNRENIFYISRTDNNQVNQLPIMPYIGLEYRY